MEFRRIAATIYKSNLRWRKAVALAKQDKLYKVRRSCSMPYGNPGVIVHSGLSHSSVPSWQLSRAFSLGSIPPAAEMLTFPGVKLVQGRVQNVGCCLAADPPDLTGWAWDPTGCHGDSSTVRGPGNC